MVPAAGTDGTADRFNLQQKKDKTKKISKKGSRQG
jgi:hypothetical protein